MVTDRVLPELHLCVLVAFTFLHYAAAQFSYSPLGGSTVNITIDDPFRLKITHLESTPTEILISWHVSRGYTVQDYLVQHRQDRRETWVNSPPQSGNQTKYSISGLQSDSIYEVCILMNYTYVYNVLSSARECSVLYTIPYIRMDSILAVSVTLGYILLMVLIGFCHWQRKKVQFEKKQAEKERLQQHEDEVLICKPDPRPHCSIEERTTSL